jgi:17beta-estradiol 17-dehydrogenase / very-long-chain 3-oxoacyl-CoA reductase
MVGTHSLIKSMTIEYPHPPLLSLICLLIEIVGVGTDVPTPFDETPISDVINIINVNVTFSTRITQALVPILTRQKRSAIVNLSSLSAIVPAPLLSLYAGIGQ